MLYLKILRLYNQIQFAKKIIINELIYSFTEKTIFIRDYYRLNDLVWQDGFLIDFLQKKVIDKWLRKFVIYSGYLYSERMVFDYVIKFYLELVVWVGHYYSLFEFNNVASTLLLTLFLALWCFLWISLCYIGWIFL